MIKQNKINKIQCLYKHMRIEQNIVLYIIKRELSKGIFDNTCTANERMKLRKFISKNYNPSYKHLKVEH